jgi:tryptophan 2,3-dioxygenase
MRKLPLGAGQTTRNKRDQLGEELTDLEDAFRLWRFRHVTTVERIIGFKRGTGGTSGVSYLRKMLDVVLFPEIWKMRTNL